MWVQLYLWTLFLYLETLLGQALWKACEQHVKTMWTEFTMWNILWNKNIFLVQKNDKEFDPVKYAVKILT